MTNAVTIVCVTHRKGGLLRAVMKGVVRELGPHDELLVVDDGGDDWPVFSEVATTSPRARLRYVSVPHNGYRLSLMCNIGVMLAAHERIVKIDGDVVPRRGWLEAHRYLVARGTLVCGRIEWRQEGGGVAKDSRFDYTRQKGCVGPRKSYGGNLGFLRGDLLDLGLFDPVYHGAWGAEDAEIGEKYRVSGRRVVFCFDATVEHQWHPPSQFRREVRRNRRLLRDRIRKFERGHLPQSLPRDGLQIVVGEGAGDVEFDDLLEDLRLPYKVATEPLATISRRLHPGELVLYVLDSRDLNASTVEQLYAYLKADESCAAVTPEQPERSCVLLRGSASWEMARVIAVPTNNSNRGRQPEVDGRGLIAEHAQRLEIGDSMG